jgi:hypothetical protein
MCSWLLVHATTLFSSLPGVIVQFHRACSYSVGGGYCGFASPPAVMAVTPRGSVSVTVTVPLLDAAPRFMTSTMTCPSPSGGIVVGKVLAVSAQPGEQLAYTEPSGQASANAGVLNTPEAHTARPAALTRAAMGRAGRPSIGRHPRSLACVARRRAPLRPSDLPAPIHPGRLIALPSGCRWLSWLWSSSWSWLARICRGCASCLWGIWRSSSSSS